MLATTPGVNYFNYNYNYKFSAFKLSTKIYNYYGLVENQFNYRIWYNYNDNYYNITTSNTITLINYNNI